MKGKHMLDLFMYCIYLLILEEKQITSAKSPFDHLMYLFLGETVKYEIYFSYLSNVYKYIFTSIEKSTQL